MSLVSYFVSAHQDDWQLFRGEQAIIDVTLPDTRVIFVYVTAGELDQQGHGVPPERIWPAREKGALASIESVTQTPHSEGEEVDINGQVVTRFESGNTRSYFMRLAQGIGDLQAGAADTWPTVDGKPPYSWGKLTETLRAILDLEHLDADSPPWVNTHSDNIEVNSDDNPDHWATGAAVAEAIADGAYRLLPWIDYRIATLDANLTPEHAEQKRRLMRDAYSATFAAETGIDDWAIAGAIYEGWIPKSYYAGSDEPLPSEP